MDYVFKYKPGDILIHYTKFILKVKTVNAPFPGVYTLYNLSTGKLFIRNKDTIEKTCELAPVAAKVLYDKSDI